MKILIFKLADAKYGIALETVSELFSLDGWTQIPLSRDYCPGIVSMRKTFIPLINLKMLLNHSTIDLINKTLIIVEVNGHQRALIVEEIIEIASVTVEQKINSNKYISKIFSYKGEQILLLNIELVMSIPIFEN